MCGRGGSGEENESEDEEPLLSWFHHSVCVMECECVNV